jgi:transcriptional regulator with XRE-family HTH domain
MQPAVAFGRVLRRLRQKKGLTQEQLGLEADLRRTFVSILELGQQQPTLTTILKLANVLEVKPSKILDLVEREIQDFGSSSLKGDSGIH